MPKRPYIIKQILKNDNKWCNMMGIYNPYIDPWDNYISKQVADFDYQAYKKHKSHNHVYDKLWVIQSQGLQGGTLEDFSGEGVQYPIFIKPRWGHKSATSKNCFKIKHPEQLRKYRHIPEMIWSEFIDAREQMTDFFLLDGEIQHQITYIYSDEQHGSIGDVWKYISPDSKPPAEIVQWVNVNMQGFTGPVNVQYRGDKIIEVSLRLARGGSYILSTQNDAFIDNINNLVEDKVWDESIEPEMRFEPYYAFKCISDVPLVYLYPQYTLDSIMKYYDCMPFYEYYFEPSGQTGSTIMQFCHKDFKSGMRAKKHIEILMTITQLFFYAAFFGLIISLIRNPKSRFVRTFGVIVLILFGSKILNSFSVHYDLYKCQKQMFL